MWKILKPVLLILGLTTTSYYCLVRWIDMNSWNLHLLDYCVLFIFCYLVSAWMSDVLEAMQSIDGKR